MPLVVELGRLLVKERLVLVVFGSMRQERRCWKGLEAEAREAKKGLWLIRVLKHDPTRDGTANLDRQLFDSDFKSPTAFHLGLSPGFIAPKLGKVLGLHVHRGA